MSVIFAFMNKLFGDIVDIDDCIMVGDISG